MSTIAGSIVSTVTLGAVYNLPTVTAPLTIGSTGTIDVAAGDGVYGPGDSQFAANWTIDNSGAISAGGFGILLGDRSASRAANGVITNERGGSIDGGSAGIAIYGAGTILNRGSIHGSDKGIYSGIGTVANSGQIGATGVAVGLGGGFITNSAGGNISGGASGAAIGGTGGGVINGGGITGSTFGIVINSGLNLGTVNNTGTVIGDGLSHGVGVALERGNVDNSSVSALIEGYATGAYIHAAGCTLINYGTIAATGTGGIGVDLAAGGAVVAAGTISGRAAAVSLGANLTNNILALEAGYKLVGGVVAKGLDNELQLVGNAGAPLSVDYDGLGLSGFQSLFFIGGYSALKVSDLGGTLPLAVYGFKLPSERIDLTAVGADGSLAQSGTVVTVTGSLGSESFRFGAGDFMTFATTPDGDSGTDVVPACFLRGTLILTPGGERPVEDLRIGDQVVTFSGEAQAVRWVGHRAYDRRFVARNRAVLPIRIAAGALADGVPSRDLHVSPGHALLVEGVLVPVELLLNGTTIRQADSVADIEYFHVELAKHQVIFAEGAATESYVDCDNRAIFANAAEHTRLYPGDERPRWSYCARRLEWNSPDLLAIRTRLLARAPAPVDALPNDPDAPALLRFAGGGALPYGWRWWSAAGLGVEVIGGGDEGTAADLAIRLFGTPKSTSAANQIFFGGATAFAAAPGEHWRVSARLGLLAGSRDNIRAVEIAANLNDAAGRYVGWFGSRAIALEDRAGLAGREWAHAGVVTEPAAVYLQPLIQVAVFYGRPIDLTLRITASRAERLAAGAAA